MPPGIQTFGRHDVVNAHIRRIAGGSAFEIEKHCEGKSLKGRRAMKIPSLLAILAVSVPGAVQAKQQAQDLASQRCAACHGERGQSTSEQFPNLAGQKPGYIVVQLRAFRSGTRPSDIMKGLARDLSDGEIGELAAFYAHQEPARPSAGKAERALIQQGAAIFSSSGYRRPACSSCHAVSSGSWFGRLFHMGGMMGHGMMGGGMMMTDPAETPRLSGQHAAYLLAQLNSFASGKRPNAVMSPIAASLTPADRKAVSSYLATLR